MEYKVILYYKYIPLSEPSELVSWHKTFCEKHGIKGRVLIADEGINGTLAGTTRSVNAYIEKMREDPRFEDIDFKESFHNEIPFPKLKVKYRKEIVTLGLSQDIDMTSQPRGKYLTPEELQKKIESQSEFIFVDVRNHYESKIGRFRGAITPEISTFKEFPQFLQSITHLKDRPLVFYCTGGIRCEKASAYAISQGFKKVYQIKGGIHRYAEKFPKGAFEGRMYVFDDRIGVIFDDSPDRKILTNCESCGTPHDLYQNCLNPDCNRMMIICDKCFKMKMGFCSEECSKRCTTRRKDMHKFEKILGCSTSNS